MYKHLYCVPTHRLISREIMKGFFEEVQFANNKYEVNCPLVIFEDSEEEIHKELLCKLGESYKNIDVYYITRNVVRSIYDEIASYLGESEKDIFGKLYPNTKVNYGNVLNRMFIFSFIFGAQSISRRDSDVIVRREVDGKELFPIEYELKYLGNKFNDKTVYVCGGGYNGKYGLDIESFVKGNDYTCLKKIFTLMSIPEEFHDEIIEVDVLQNGGVFQDNIILDADNFPHCGNIGYYKMHEYFPCSPQDLVIGSDSFITELTALSKLNLALHSRAVYHKHTAERKEYSNSKRYWLGFLMYIDNQTFYRCFYNRHIVDHDFNNDNFKDLSKELSGEMNGLLGEMKKNFVDHRRKKCSECIALLKQSSDENIVCIAEEFEAEGIIEEVIKTTNESVKQHAELIVCWEKVVDISKMLGERGEFKDIICKVQM